MNLSWARSSLFHNTLRLYKYSLDLKSFSCPFARLVEEEEGLFFTRPRLLNRKPYKDSERLNFDVVKKSKLVVTIHKLGLPYFANSFADTAFEDNCCSGLSFAVIC